MEKWSCLFLDTVLRDSYMRHLLPRSFVIIIDATCASIDGPMILRYFLDLVAFQGLFLLRSKVNSIED